MPIPLSLRSKKVSPSQTLSISTLSNRLLAQKKEVVNLAVGQSDFVMPAHAKQAAIEAVRNDMTRYTAVDGTAELKHSIADKFKRENDLDYADAQIIVSNGAKHSLALLCQTLLNSGDEVIIPAPFWTTYPEIVRLADGKPVIITAPITQDFKMTAEQLETHINERTKMLLLNSPNNPAGTCYTADEFAAIGAVLERHPQVLICSDDIYEHFVFDDKPFINILNVCPDLYPRTIVINGVSKAYSMTGLRIGYSAGPAEVVAGMKKIQSQSTSNPCSISQAAACAALEGDNDFLSEVRQEFVKRRDFLVAQLGQFKGVDLVVPTGSFYIFPDFSCALDTFDKASDDLTLAEYLLKELYVATVPGIAFGMPNHLRISFSIAFDALERGCERLAKVF